MRDAVLIEPTEHVSEEFLDLSVPYKPLQDTMTQSHEK